MTDLSKETIREKLAGVAARAELYRGDLDLNPGLAEAFSSAHIPAAVLILLIERPAGLTVLLTRRPAMMRVHAGQIAFPGGRAEANDNGPAGTALRETREEIGLADADIEILGQLPEYQTRTGYTVAPVVGMVRPPFTLQANPDEVEEIIEVPLAFFLNTANCRMEEREMTGHTARFYSFTFEGKKVWGATAGMLRGLRDVLIESTSPRGARALKP